MTPSGYIKRAQANRTALQTGQRYCTSCMTYQPRAQVRRYRRERGQGTVLRCDACQANRLAAMAEVRRMRSV